MKLRRIGTYVDGEVRLLPTVAARVGLTAPEANPLAIREWWRVVDRVAALCVALGRSVDVVAPAGARIGITRGCLTSDLRCRR